MRISKKTIIIKGKKPVNPFKRTNGAKLAQNLSTNYSL